MKREMFFCDKCERSESQLGAMIQIRTYTLYPYGYRSADNAEFELCDPCAVKLLQHLLRWSFSRTLAPMEEWLREALELKRWKVLPMPEEES